jgi:hypothetical protein
VALVGASWEMGLQGCDELNGTCTCGQRTVQGASPQLTMHLLNSGDTQQGASMLLLIWHCIFGGFHDHFRVSRIFASPLITVSLFSSMTICPKIKSRHQGTSQVQRLSTGFPYKVLSLSTKSEGPPWQPHSACMSTCWKPAHPSLTTL